MVHQIGEGLGGAEPLEISRRCADKPPVRHDAARREPAVGKGAESDCQIDPAIDQVDRPVCHFQLDFNVRVPLGEFRNERRYRRSTEAERRVHAQ
ncbi:hypothetical protein D3C86_1456920 [compost metagenome]